ncbi:MAG TPA: SRPBCC family protein [Candidatus Baltobacteraceae bacterium]|jgi:uncharacterized protein YndB with AHSA1/START domain
MSTSQQYSPGPANMARVQKNGETWTLILVKELRHSADKVWQALTDPVELSEWAPFKVSGNLSKVGSTVQLTWIGAPSEIETKVKRAEPPKLLEYSCGDNDMRWELEAVSGGTRLTLWSIIDRNYISMGAAGWHIALDVLEQKLNGTPIGPIAGSAAMQFEGWQRLNAEYAQQFGIELPKWG